MSILPSTVMHFTFKTTGARINALLAPGRFVKFLCNNNGLHDSLIGNKIHLLPLASS